jgi:glycosyltransferase involved in cell wall biosynthesis
MEELVAALAQIDFPVEVMCHWDNPFLPGWHAKVLELLARYGFSKVEKKGGELNLSRVTDDKGDVAFLVTHPERSLRLPTTTIYWMYSWAEFGVFPFRAEGWGLPILECLAKGRPVICQNYSGPTEYLTEGAYLPLEGYDAIAQDGLFFHGDRGTWKKVEVPSLVNAIRRAREIRMSDQYTKMADAAYDIGKRFSWDRSAKETMAFVRQIEEMM